MVMKVSMQAMNMAAEARAPGTALRRWELAVVSFERERLANATGLSFR